VHPCLCSSYFSLALPRTPRTPRGSRQNQFMPNSRDIQKGVGGPVSRIDSAKTASRARARRREMKGGGVRAVSDRFFDFLVPLRFSVQGNVLFPLLPRSLHSRWH
jgi:hypothetical protein